MSYESVYDNYGTASADELEPGVWWLARVFVKSGERNAGQGTRLLNELKAKLKKRNAEYLIVCPGGYGSSVERLQEFYTKNGFLFSGDGVGRFFFGRRKHGLQNDSGDPRGH